MRPDVCIICSGNRALDRHHVHARGMGGSKSKAVHGDDNLVTLCRTCHRNIHEGGWELQRSATMVRVIDRRTGQEIMRRAQSPNFDPRPLFQLLNVIDNSLEEAVALVPYLDDDQLVEVFRASRSLGKRAWMLQAAILYEGQRRSIYGDRALGAIARSFEISLRQAEKYALVWGLFFVPDETDNGDERSKKNVNVDAFSLEEPSWYVVAASESPEPQRWLAYAQDRKAEDPRYSINQFRTDIQQSIGAAAVQIESAQTDSIHLNERAVWDCPWVKPYCTRSGRPMPAEQCACEAED